MITKLTKKLESQQQANEQAMFHKLLFLSLVFMLIIGLNMFSQNRQKNKISKTTGIKAAPALSSKDIPSVLGEQIAQRSGVLQKQFDEGLELADRYKPQLEVQLSSQAGQLIEKGKKNIEDTLAPIIYSHTLEPILNQINKLPGSQQRYIKQQICTDQDLLRKD